MSFKTASAILRGKWLIDKQWAEAHMPIVFSALLGKGSLSSLMDAGEGEKETEDKNQPFLALARKHAGSVYKVGYYSDLSMLPQGSIAMVTMAGPITKYGDICAYGSVDYEQLIARLGRAENVAGIILNIDGPGGEAAGTASLAETIKSVTDKKPVIGFINDGIAASAHMWIISACTEIFVTQKTDMVGSIGVYTTIADWLAYYESQGLPVKEIYAPQSTDKNKNYYDALQGDTKGIEEELKILAQEFINTVAKNRAGKIQGTDWQTGKMFYANDAIKNGLIDGIKTFDQVVRRMDKLISQQQNSNTNNMAFEKTLTAANSEQFEVVDGGFLLTEDQLNSIEAKLNDADAQAAGLTETQTALDAATAAQQTAEENLATAQQTIATLEAKVAELEQEDASGSDTGKQKDQFAGEDVSMPAYEKEIRAKLD